MNLMLLYLTIVWASINHFVNLLMLQYKKGIFFISPLGCNIACVVTTFICSSVNTCKHDFCYNVSGYLYDLNNTRLQQRMYVSVTDDVKGPSPLCSSEGVCVPTAARVPQPSWRHRLRCPDPADRSRRIHSAAAVLQDLNCSLLVLT